MTRSRVGCIRKLRLGQTLKRKSGGGWKIDFSSIRDQHKTSRFYGPFAASLPGALTPILDKYSRVLEMEPGGDAAYLFHPPQSGFDRSMEPSAWTGWVKRLFKRWHGTEIAPKTLRSVRFWRPAHPPPARASTLILCGRSRACRSSSRGCATTPPHPMCSRAPRTR